MGWGVAAALLANVLYSTGFVLEKRALAGLPPLSAARPGRALLLLAGSPLWLVGALALAAGFAAQLVVYRVLPIAVAQGLFVSGLVLLLPLSSVVLGERLTAAERRGVAVIGAALLALVASLHDSAEPIARTAPADTLLALCGPALGLAVWLYVTAERRARRRHRPPPTGVAYAVAIGLLYGVSSLAIKGVSGHLTAAGLADALPALLASPHPYLLLLTGALGLVLSQTALQRCRASLIVPVCTTVTCVFSVACGTVAFGEPLPQDPLRLALRLGGTALALAVVLTLPRHGAHRSAHEGTPHEARRPAAEDPGLPARQGPADPGSDGLRALQSPPPSPLPRARRHPAASARLR